MRTAVVILWLLQAATPVAQTPPEAGAQTDPPRRPSGGSSPDAPLVRPDFSADFDPFAPNTTPAPPPPRFDPARPTLAVEADPLAALIRNGPAGAVLAPSMVDEPWRLPGVRRVPTLADPPPGSAPATKAGPAPR